MAGPDPVQITHLANGVTILGQVQPHARCAALGVWLINGGRHQAPSQAGYAHLLEHLVFKGSVERDALALARRFEAMGGQINAHTGRELTCLHGLVPAQNTLELLELFLGMLLTPRFDAQDLTIERDVILQEMAMVEDTPEEALEEAGISHAWPWHPLGWPILGRRKVLEDVRVPEVRAYLSEVLRGRRIVIATVGAVEHEAVVRACAPLASLPLGGPPAPLAPRFVAGSHRKRREVSQSHHLWAMAAPAISDPLYPTLLLANHMLGGGFSSRLFQEVRETRGLAYNIQSRLDLYADSGLWLIQTSCDPQRSVECRRAVDDTLRHFAQHGPYDDELASSIEHLRAALLIAEDDPEDCMERIAREYIYLGRVPDIAEHLDELATVTPQAVAQSVRQAAENTLQLEWYP